MRSSLAALSGVADETRIAVEDGQSQLTWRELDEATTRFGNGIEALGGVPGSHVAICVSNRIEFVLALIGAWRAGCAYTPLKTGWTAEEVGAVLDDARTAVVVTDRDGARDAAVARDIPVVDLDTAYDAWLAGQSDQPLGDDRCGYKMPYTSGTTGRPKGVVMRGSGNADFATGWAGIAYWAEALELPGDGVHLFCSRLFNGAPQTFGFGAMARGATLRVMRQWDPAAALDELRRDDVTSTIMVPTMFRQILALPAEVRGTQRPASLRTVLHGGEPCPIPVKEAIAGVLGDVLVEYYGFTEGGMTVVRRDEWRDRPGTVGRPLPGMAVEILDDAGRPVPTGDEGTVYFVPSKGRMFHYQGDDAKTEGAHVGDAFTVGDIGRLDDDGFLYLCGRAAEIVVSAGVNVYPAEIDQALSDVPGVADLAAVGAPDDERGEVVALFVQLLPDADEPTVLSNLEATAAERLAPYKRPRAIHVVEEIPRDQTGKLLRRVLRDRLWAGRQQFAADASRR
ncbi:MAG TPA: AMP-binding protein [Mycobacteriales bacterium]|nr:AMP-binding protein [Mycobacteriales bacterium]